MVCAHRPNNHPFLAAVQCQLRLFADRAEASRFAVSVWGGRQGVDPAISQGRARDAEIVAGRL